MSSSLDQSPLLQFDTIESQAQPESTRDRRAFE
jgi:hypothetical protein